MPEVILTICVGLVLVGLMQWAVARVCRKNSVVAAWRPMLMGIAIIWGVLFVLHIHLLPKYLPRMDASSHDEIAQEIAGQLRAGDFHSAFSRPWFSNPGFELYLGIVYAVTHAPQDAVIAWFSLMAFCGLLTLLDIIARGTNAVRLPFWVVAIVCLYPEAVIWSMDTLKEGPIIWGLCAMLRFVVPDPTGKGIRRWIVPITGTVVFMVLRPYVALPWLVAIVGVQVVKRRQWGVALLSLAGIAVSCSLAIAMVPSLWSKITERGLISTLEGDYRQHQNIWDTSGSAITYEGGVPIPVVSGLVTLFLRPFPHEAPHLLAFLSGLEVWILTGAMLFSWLTFGARRKLMGQPLILACIFATILMAFVFTYQINLGTMVRARIQFFPALVAFAAAPGLVARGAHFRVQRDRRLRSVSPSSIRPSHPMPLPRPIRG